MAGQRRWQGRAAIALALATLLPAAAAAAAAAATATATAATAAGSAAVATPSATPRVAAAGDAASIASSPLAVAGDGIPQPLPGAAPGDAARGRAIVANRQLGLCLLCHTGPIPEERFQGNLATDLRGAGQRWTAAQLRLRIADASQINPSTIMPSYYKTEGLTRVAATYQGQTILTAQQIEDVVAWLQTLKDTPP
jgi:sulfur-oxidizing protein SoxX